ncbi:SapB/AmfS family lanthipeptide [Streptomyces sp. NPDC002054]
MSMYDLQGLTQREETEAQMASGGSWFNCSGASWFMC